MGQFAAPRVMAMFQPSLHSGIPMSETERHGKRLALLACALAILGAMAPYHVHLSAAVALRHKRVRFLAHVFRLFDSDGLQAAIKPCRDALVECHVLSGDGPRDGNEFLYDQEIDRARRGVTIRVSLL